MRYLTRNLESHESLLRSDVSMGDLTDRADAVAGSKNSGDGKVYSHRTGNNQGGMNLADFLFYH